MTVDLTQEEIETIEGWYLVSAGESGNSRDVAMFALLDKLGIHADGRDLWIPDPMHTIADHRAKVYETIAAIKAYRDRHPDYDEVIESIEDQP